MIDEDSDPDTGELRGPVAADGARSYPAAHTLADFIRMQEDGQFNLDVGNALNELAGDLEEIAETNGGGKIKAQLTIKIDITREHGGLYRFASDYSIKRPKETRPQSVGWVTGDNKFTPNKPNQGNLFGTVRDVTPRREIIG